MEGFSGINTTVRKRRSQASRRPQPDSQPSAEAHDHSPLSSLRLTDDAGKVSSDESADFDANHKQKEFVINQRVFLVSSNAGVEGEKSRKRSKREDGGFNEIYNNELGRSGSNSKRFSEGVLAPTNWKTMNKVTKGLELELGESDIHHERSGGSLSPMHDETLDELVKKSKINKKLKVKGDNVTHYNQANSAANSMPGSESSTKKNDLQRDKEDQISPQDKRIGLQGIPWKDFSRGGFGFGKGDSLMGKRSEKNVSGKQGDQADPIRKSTRAPKRRVLDGEFSEGDEDGEIRYLEKLKTLKIYLPNKDSGEESGKNAENVGASRSGKDGKKKPKSDKGSEETVSEEEGETVSDDELEGIRKSKQQKGSDDSLTENKREMTLTKRQRALQSSKDASVAGGASLIEFPNGLPPAPRRKQKEKLTESEQQLKKAEAAQRRKIQVEKALEESEAEAIRKILGQDSNRKKREIKMKKRQEELAQEKATSAEKLASSTVRLVIGPNGTTVTFPQAMGLPSIFDSKPISYPPPREKCVGPSCSNPFKYRDSKTKVPLCSFECYKAVQKQQETEHSS